MTKVTKINLLFLSLGSIIGSGWLYGAFYTAKTAGNSGVISWILGGIMYAIIALSYAEVALNKNFNNLSEAAGFTFGNSGKTLVSILTWIWTALIPPIEVQATIQYASNYFPWIKGDSKDFSLSIYGVLFAVFLMFVMFFINIFAINTVGKFNKWITVFKVIIPSVVIGIFCYVIFLNPHNAMQNLNSELFSSGMSGTLTAISSCGIAFSFIGFQTAIFLANETVNPQKNVPFAVFGSIFIACIIYVLLQITFNLSIPSQYLSNGWENLNFNGDAGPIAGLLAIFGFVSISLFLYIDAIISPFGTGLSYKISASRVLSDMGSSKILPKFLSLKNRFGSPYVSNFLNFLIGVAFILSVSGWQNMITILCGLIILTTTYVPLYALYARGSQYFESSFKTKNYNFISFLSFYFSNLMLVWCGWETIKYILVVFSILFVYILVKDIFKRNFQFNSIFHILIPIHMFSIGTTTYLKSNIDSVYFELVSQFLISLILIVYLKFLILKNPAEVNKKEVTL